MRGVLAVLVMIGSGCGRLHFDLFGGDTGGGADAARGDGALPSGDGALPAGDGDALVTCTTNPGLGASGCLAGTGPYDLWVFHDVVAGVVPDSSGRGCVPLSGGAVVVVADGIDTTNGTLGSSPGDAAATFTAIEAASGVTLELWAHTTNTPGANADMAALSDAGGARTRLVQSTTFSGGNVSGMGTSTPYSTRNFPDGTTQHLVITSDGAGVRYFITDYETASGSALTFAWMPASAQITFGPWTGTVVRAAVYDRSLSNAEILCLNSAGVAALP